jgi:hypothetical protein
MPQAQLLLLLLNAGMAAFAPVLASFPLLGLLLKSGRTWRKPTRQRRLR